MNFTAYIERQKRLIRDRHEGETYLLQKGECIPMTESERLFEELCNLQGLNVKERRQYGRAV